MPAAPCSRCWTTTKHTPTCCTAQSRQQFSTRLRSSRQFFNFFTPLVQRFLCNISLFPTYNLLLLLLLLLLPLLLLANDLPLTALAEDPPPPSQSFYFPNSSSSPAQGGGGSGPIGTYINPDDATEDVEAAALEQQSASSSPMLVLHRSKRGVHMSSLERVPGAEGMAATSAQVGEQGFASGSCGGKTIVVVRLRLPRLPSPSCYGEEQSGVGIPNNYGRYPRDAEYRVHFGGGGDKNGATPSPLVVRVSSQWTKVADYTIKYKMEAKQYTLGCKSGGKHHLGKIIPLPVGLNASLPSTALPFLAHIRAEAEANVVHGSDRRNLPFSGLNNYKTINYLTVRHPPGDDGTDYILLATITDHEAEGGGKGAEAENETYEPLEKRAVEALWPDNVPLEKAFFLNRDKIEALAGDKKKKSLRQWSQKFLQSWSGKKDQKRPVTIGYRKTIGGPKSTRSVYVEQIRLYDPFRIDLFRAEPHIKAHYRTLPGDGEVVEMTRGVITIQAVDCPINIPSAYHQQRHQPQQPGGSGSHPTKQQCSFKVGVFPTHSDQKATVIDALEKRYGEGIPITNKYHIETKAKEWRFLQLEDGDVMRVFISQAVDLLYGRGIDGADEDVEKYLEAKPEYTSKFEFDGVKTRTYNLPRFAFGTGPPPPTDAPITNMKKTNEFIPGGLMSPISPTFTGGDAKATEEAAKKKELLCIDHYHMAYPVEEQARWRRQATDLSARATISIANPIIPATTTPTTPTTTNWLEHVEVVSYLCEDDIAALQLRATLLEGNSSSAVGGNATTWAQNTQINGADLLIFNARLMHLVEPHSIEGPRSEDAENKRFTAFIFEYKAFSAAIAKNQKNQENRSSVSIEEWGKKVVEFYMGPTKPGVYVDVIGNEYRPVVYGFATVKEEGKATRTTAAAAAAAEVNQVEPLLRDWMELRGLDLYENRKRNGDLHCLGFVHQTHQNRGAKNYAFIPIIHPNDVQYREKACTKFYHKLVSGQKPQQQAGNRGSWWRAQQKDELYSVEPRHIFQMATVSLETKGIHYGEMPVKLYSQTIFPAGRNPPLDMFQFAIHAQEKISSSGGGGTAAVSPSSPRQQPARYLQLILSLRAPSAEAAYALEKQLDCSPGPHRQFPRQRQPQQQPHYSCSRSESLLRWLMPIGPLAAGVKIDGEATPLGIYSVGMARLMWPDFQKAYKDALAYVNDVLAKGGELCEWLHDYPFGASYSLKDSLWEELKKRDELFTNPAHSSIQSIEAHKADIVRVELMEEAEHEHQPPTMLSYAVVLPTHFTADKYRIHKDKPVELSEMDGKFHLLRYSLLKEGVYEHDGNYVAEAVDRKERHKLRSKIPKEQRLLGYITNNTFVPLNNHPSDHHYDDNAEHLSTIQPTSPAAAASTNTARQAHPPPQQQSSWGNLLPTWLVGGSGGGGTTGQ